LRSTAAISVSPWRIASSPAGKRGALLVHWAPGELAGVALAGVELDRELVELGRAAGGDALARTRALRGAGGLPEDHRPPAGAAGIGR
jgi:hypothetical protein